MLQGGRGGGDEGGCSSWEPVQGDDAPAQREMREGDGGDETRREREKAREREKMEERE